MSYAIYPERTCTCIRILFLTILLASMAACSGSAGPGSYRPQSLAELQPGKSTIEDAEHLFGEPTSRMEAEGKGVLLQWQFRKTGAAPGATDSHVAILFDDDGRMIRIVRATRR